MHKGRRQNGGKEAKKKWKEARGRKDAFRYGLIGEGAGAPEANGAAVVLVCTKSPPPPIDAAAGTGWVN